MPISNGDWLCSAERWLSASTASQCSRAVPTVMANIYFPEGVPAGVETVTANIYFPEGSPLGSRQSLPTFTSLKGSPLGRRSYARRNSRNSAAQLRYDR